MEGFAAIVFVILVVGLLQLFRRKSQPEFEITDEFREILRILNQTSEPVFITGKAGTGKSSLLRYFVKTTSKKFVVLAPTGIAALNVDGQTIHSFFRFPPTTINAESISADFVRGNLFKALEMVIIDEVSMVRSDLLNGVDVALRINRNKPNIPFGGIQVVFIGDLFQLPPVVIQSEREAIISKYGGEYFFYAPGIRQINYHFKELTKIFRQREGQEKFKALLNRVRVNQVTFDDFVLLNSRHRDNQRIPEDSIFLTSRKEIARNINHEKLDSLKSPAFNYKAELTGKYNAIKDLDPDKAGDKFPAPVNLKLKLGAHVMTVRNDLGKRWVNGSVGTVSRISPHELWIKFSGKEHKLELETWKEVEYRHNSTTEKIEPVTVASFTQYPVQLAYAMTIHKAQGKTFDKITVDIGTGAFAHGQVYVALSRCRTLEGITLNNPIGQADIIVDPRVVEYYELRRIPSSESQASANKQKSTISNGEIAKSLLDAIASKRNVVIEYINYDGVASKRELSEIRISNKYVNRGYLNQHITAYCHLKREEREFKIDRIRSIRIK